MEISENNIPQDANFYSAGWGIHQNKIVLQYMVLNLLNKEECRNAFSPHRQIKSNEICLTTQRGYFNAVPMFIIFYN